MKALTTTVASYLFATTFLVFGVMHLMMAGNFAGMIPGWLPGGIFWVYLTGLALIGAGLSIFLNKQVYLAMMLLALMLLIFILILHLPAVMGGNQMAMGGLLKDMGLMGAALTHAGLAKN